MNMIEYVEKILGVKLYSFQKSFLKRLEELPPHSRLISTPRGMMVIEESFSKEVYGQMVQIDKAEFDERKAKKVKKDE